MSSALVQFIGRLVGDIAGERSGRRRRPRRSTTATAPSVRRGRVGADGRTGPARSGCAPSSGPATRPRRWPRRTASTMPASDQPPRHVEAVDAVAGRLLDPWHDGDPPATPSDAPNGGDRADHRATRHHDEAQVPLGRSDRGEHPQLAQAPLGDDDEARGGDQRDEEQHDRGDDEHAHGGEHVLGQVALWSRRCVRCRRAAGTTGRGRRTRRRASITESDAATSDGTTSANSSSRSLGFSTRPTTVRSTPSRASTAPMSRAKRLGHPVGHGDLVGAGRDTDRRADRASVSPKGPGGPGSR